jgi:glycosyltransferase involved in cell wall biosynthesis/protein-L-isoaspartate O-methyltransferase
MSGNTPLSSLSVSNSTQNQWQRIYEQTPLRDVPQQFAGIAHSQFMLRYLSRILELCPRGGRTLETGIGSGYGAIWLSLRGVLAHGIDYVPALVERARHINSLLGGSARFEDGDLFRLFADWQRPGNEPYHVIHHQGVLEHFTVPQIRAALAQQLACAHHVVFSVPSVYYPFEPEFGDERLLPLAEWERILAPFAVEELALYGDPQFGGQEHVLCVLRGCPDVPQKVEKTLLPLMQVPDEPYRRGISAIVQTRNEARHLAACLETLQGWTDQIIVCDMESEDDTVEIAKRFTDEIIYHPRIDNFDRARNVSAMRAEYSWVFYLDADERVPPALGQALCRLVIGEEGNPARPEFEALLVPFRHHFAGHWMRSLYPGYTAPRLYKNGRFVFNARPHSGAQVDGRIACFPADNPDLALVHYSYDSLSHYLDKLNRYTDSEAANLHRDGQPFHWTRAVRHFVQDFQRYYDRGGAARDGVHGFLYSFLSGFYRFEQHAKLYEKRFASGELQETETGVPGSVEEVLEYALSVLREKPLPQAPPIRVQEPETLSNPSASTHKGQPASQDSEAEPDEPATGRRIPACKRDVVWSGPLLDPSGYGEESRHFALALQEVGIPIAIQPLPWSHDQTALIPEEHAALQAMSERAVKPGFVHITQNFPPAFAPHPQAGLRIGRTMFETDRLPAEWVRACNRMDFIWVPTEFNRETFAAAGVTADKLRVVPGCFDPEPYRRASEAGFSEPEAASPLQQQMQHLREQGTFCFFTLFDWSLHKGWDVLLRAFLQEFEGNSKAHLFLKVWSTLGYSAEAMRQQAAQWVQRELGHDLLNDERIHFVFERFTRAQMIGLYQSCDAFVLPSRGEGWGRPLMEAMACATPTIGTGWSGNTAFMHGGNSYLVEASVVNVPERGWREIPTCKGHRWAEPSWDGLRQALRRVREEPGEARQRALQGQQEVAERFNRQVVGSLMVEDLQRAQAAWEQKHRPQPWLSTNGLSRQNLSTPSSHKNSPHTPSLSTPIPSTPGHSAENLVSSLAVRWEGAFFSWHSLAHVNRELCQRLMDGSQEGNASHESPAGQEDPKGQECSASIALFPIELSLVPTEAPGFSPQQEGWSELAHRAFAPLSRPADVHVRHFFPPRFEAPSAGRLVLMQPWEYGFLPEAWIEPIQKQVDEVWCYSRYVRDVYLASGIEESKLHIVPLGVDEQVFHPAALPYVFTDEPGAGAFHSAASRRPFVFLFTGGTLHRKGIDILLAAYQKAFTALDDVCLVIKDTGTRGVYAGQNAREEILQLIVRQEAEYAPLVYLDKELAPRQLAGLYAATDCLIQPYRGEGFCLPALEAMACGKPVIATAGGPTDDFLDESVGWRLPSTRKPINVLPHGKGRIEPFDCVGPTWMFEVGVEALAKLMREVAQNREEAKKRGQAARERVVNGWTWRHSAMRVIERLQALQSEGGLRPQKLLSEEKNASVPPDKLPAASNTASRSSVLTLGSVSESPLESRKKPTLSLCMIVKNEERVLGECLGSIKPHVDEMIVVDTGSTDRTVDIAKEAGAKVYHFPWTQSFSEARNVSLQHATGDWILWMDADDTIPPQCGQKLRELIALAEDKTTGFLMQVHIPPAPGEEGFTVVDHVKLFRNGLGLQFEGRIHEQILESIYRVGGRVERSDLYVVHSGYDHSPEGQAHKRERDLSLLQLDQEERPGHPFVLFNIGMTAYHLKEYERAREALEMCLERSKPRESTVRKAYAMLAGCYRELKCLDQAVETIERGLRYFPHDPELLFRAGIIYRETGNLERAAASYEKLLKKREVGHIDSLDVSLASYKAHHNLGIIYLDMGRLAEARKQWQSALECNARFEPSRQALEATFVHRDKCEIEGGVKSRYSKK